MLCMHQRRLRASCKMPQIYITLHLLLINHPKALEGTALGKAEVGGIHAFATPG